jgi:hypothetical protein
VGHLLDGRVGGAVQVVKWIGLGCLVMMGVLALVIRGIIVKMGEALEKLGEP